MRTVVKKRIAWVILAWPIIIVAIALLCIVHLIMVCWFLKAGSSVRPILSLRVISNGLRRLSRAFLWPRVWADRSADANPSTPTNLDIIDPDLDELETLLLDIPPTPARRVSRPPTRRTRTPARRPKRAAA